MHDERPSRAAEGALIVLFLAWLCWLPLPFGSIVDRARLPLVAVPLALCALATIVRITWGGLSNPPAAWRIWSIGAIAFLALSALQLIPLPMPLLRIVSPASATIWSGS